MHKLLRCEIPCYILQDDLHNSVANTMAYLCFLKKRGWVIISSILVLLVNEALREGSLSDGHLAKNLNRHPLRHIHYTILLRFMLYRILATIAACADL